MKERVEHIYCIDSNARVNIVEHCEQSIAKLNTIGHQIDKQENENQNNAQELIQRKETVNHK